MFKSSENLRLAAQMRALTRVASPWREARTSWWDGTPESIESRLAATDKVLTHARSGFTAAHLSLTREAEYARRELIEARHRLMTDFLDDGARAFTGSKRVAESQYSEDDDDDEYEGRHRASRRTAGPPLVHPDISFSNSIQYPGDKEDNRFTLQQFRDVGPDETVEHRRQNPSVGIFNHDASEMLTNGGAHHWASHLAAAEDEACEGCNAEAGEECRPWCTGKAKHDDEKKTSMRTAAITFLAGQNTADRQELLFRAHRHAADRTGQLPVPTAQRVVQAFVAAVNREIPRTRPAARRASAPAAVADFDDQLLFDS
jgi:hypothetical protein